MRELDRFPHSISPPAAIKSGLPLLVVDSLPPLSRAGRCVAVGGPGRRVYFFVCMLGSVFFLPKSVTPNHP